MQTTACDADEPSCCLQGDTGLALCTAMCNMAAPMHSCVACPALLSRTALAHACDLHMAIVMTLSLNGVLQLANLTKQQKPVAALIMAYRNLRCSPTMHT